MMPPERIAPEESSWDPDPTEILQDQSDLGYWGPEHSGKCPGR